MSDAGSLADLLPEPVVVVERRHPGDPAELSAPEAVLVAAAVPARRREFAAGRACVREALVRCGMAPVPVLAAPDRRPLWPPGVRGSLTHCPGFTAAALAPAAQIAALGIDAEPAHPLDPDVADLMLDPDERAECRRLHRRAPTIPWSLLIFSAKESVYKAHTSTGAGWLDPTDVRVTPHPTGTFTAALTSTTFSGRWSCHHGLLLTATAVPA